MSSAARLPHLITPGQRVTRPAALVFLAVETSPAPLPGGRTEHIFQAAAACYWRIPDRRHKYQPHYLETNSISDVWAWLDSITRKRSRILVISSDPVRDLTVLHHAAHLPALGYKLGRPVAAARTCILPYRRESRGLTFIAASNLVPFSPPTTTDLRTTVEAALEFWRAYLEMLGEHNLGPFRLTIGSQAFATYRHRFMTHPIYVHGRPRVDTLEARACYGGCYQPYYFGQAPDDDYYYLDTNAMYPWAMATFELPYRLVNDVGRLPLPTLAAKLERYCAVATVRVRTNQPVYPVKHKGHTVFPTGEFTTTLTTPDLAHALAHGHLVECYRAAWYRRGVLFRDFVTFMWDLRRQYQDQDQPGLAKLCKAWSVALYGKWGGRRYAVKDRGEWDERECGRGILVDADTGEQCQYNILAGRMWTTSRAGLSAHAFPAIMAHIAAHSRRHLFELHDLAGRENVYFAVGDGLIINRAGYERLVHLVEPETLGRLKLKNRSRSLAIYSDTEVAMGDMVKRPGVKAGSLQVEDGVFIEEGAPRLGSQLRSGDPHRYITWERTKRLKREITSGRVTQGGRVVPLELP